MIYFWLLTNHPHYRNDIKPNIEVNAPILDVVVDCQTQTLQLTIINSFFWIAEETVTTCLYLNKYNIFTISSYDVNVASARLPIAFNNLISVAL